MSFDHDIRTRFLTSADLWGNRPSTAPSDPGYTYAHAWQPPSPAPPRQPPKTLVPNLLKTPNPRHSRNAERPMSEFVSTQLAKAQERRKKKRRPLSLPPIDTRLWLDENRYAAWLIDGRLVTIEERRERPPLVRLATVEEVWSLKAANRLIHVVIAFYPGDSLEKSGVVTRYLVHNDLERALRAAMDRALEEEHRVAEELVKEPQARIGEQPRDKGAKRFRKSRHHPMGNFIVYEPPGDGDTPFVIQRRLDVRPAFEDKRKAERYLAKKRNRQRLPDNLVITRVLQAVVATPKFREGIPLPRTPEERIELIRKEPRIVVPDLRLELVPRFVQCEDGEWRRPVFKNKRTVRHGHRDVLLNRLREVAPAQAEATVDHQVRRAVEKKYSSIRLDEQWQLADRLAHRAERILPRTVRQAVGLADCSLHYWPALNQTIHRRAPADGHWIRAPKEWGERHPGWKSRARLVELRIDDLAGLLDQFGMRLTFWMIKDDVKAAPRWALPVS